MTCGLRQHQELLKIELPMLTQDLAEDLVAHGFGRLHEAAALTARTRLAQQVFQALAISLARIHISTKPSGETFMTWLLA